MQPDLFLQMIAAGARFFLALCFGLSVLEKLRDMGRFTESVAGYRLLPEGAVPAVSLILVTAEIAVASALVLAGGFAAATAAAMLLGLFTLAITINILRGHVDIDCGCNLAGAHESLGWGLVFRNLLLLLAAAMAAAEHAAPLLLKGLGGAAGATAFLLFTAIRQLHAIRRASSRT